MGGGQSLMLGLDHLDRFSYIAAFSTAMLGISTESLDETAEFAPVAQDPGGRDSTGGIHNWVVWRRYLNEVAPLLFR